VFQSVLEGDGSSGQEGETAEAEKRIEAVLAMELAPIDGRRPSVWRDPWIEIAERLLLPGPEGAAKTAVAANPARRWTGPSNRQGTTAPGGRCRCEAEAIVQGSVSEIEGPQGTGPVPSGTNPARPWRHQASRAF
jgi:hypothetical protein